jgi:hypothetical protein
MSDKGKASLVPIAILINGKFWDASAYKADPVPMALDSGTVYEGEQTGSSLGLFTVNGALHSNAANTPAPWIATGSWHPNDAEESKKGLQAEKVPVGIETEDAPPRLSHNPTAGAQNAPADASKAPTATAPASGTDKSADSENSGHSSNSSDGPPRLNRPPSSSPEGTNNPSGAQQKPSSTPEAKPADTKAKYAKPEENVPASDSGADEGNRPRLRRGKPAESFADEDIPGYSKPGTSPSADSAKVAAAATKQENIKLIPAISDAAGPPPHSFHYEWVKGDEEDRRKQVTDMAKELVRNYVTTQQRNQIGAKPTRTAAGARRAKAPEPILENVHMIPYDLWNSNQPVIVFSADAHMPPPPEGTAHSEVQSELQYSVLLVAYPDIYNNLHKLYVGVTDKFHLDVTPRLELVDAVDADGDGRGELLFRETSDMGTGWVIYRATADKLWKMYDSLSPL